MPFGVTRYHSVSLGAIRCHSMLLGAIGCHSVPLGAIGCHTVPFGAIRCYCVSGKFQKFLRVLQERFIEVLLCNFVVVAWDSSQLPEQKEGLV